MKKVPIDDNALKLNESDKRLLECSDKEIKKSSKSKNRSNKIDRKSLRFLS